MNRHIAFASPLDVARLASEFNLRTMNEAPVPVGHGGHSVTELVVAIRDLVDRLDLVTLDPNLTRPVNLVGDGVRLAVGPFRPRARTRVKDLFSLERSFVADCLHRWSPEVVSAQWTYEYALGSLESGRPTLVTVRDWAPTIFRYQHDPYRAVRWFMQSMTLRRGSHFAAVSPYMAARVERKVDAPVSVLPNVLNPGWFESNASPDPRPQAVLALNNGFGARKNVQSLLRAWPLILEEAPDARLLLVGADYEEAGRAHRWAQKIGVGQGTDFLGPQPRSAIADHLRRSSVFVHPSREESFGMVVLEAMACCTPVIGGSSSGAVPWLLEGGAGVLVNVESPNEIAEAVVQLLRDESEARKVAKRGRDRALGEFAAEPVAHSYINALSGLTAST